MKRATILITCAALGLMTALQAFWTYVGPEGGPIYSAVATSGPGKTISIASGCQRVPLFKTTDDGQCWTRTEGILVSTPEVLVAHPTDPALLYCVSGGKLYGTTDGGNTWTGLGVPDPVRFLALDVNPEDWSEIFGGGIAEGNGYRNGVVGHSTNGGLTWGIESLATVWGSAVQGIRMWKGNHNVVIAIGNDAGIGMMLYKSTDRGASWSGNPVSIGGWVCAFDVDPADQGTLLVGASDCIYRSSDGGTSWSPVLAGRGNSFSRSPGQPGLVYAAAGVSIYRSLDNGLTWIRVADGMQGDVSACVLADPDDDNVVFGGTSVGMYKSTNRGGSWLPINNGLLQYTDFNVLAASPDDPAVAYAGAVNCYPVLRTPDRGSDWMRSGWFRGCGTLSGIAVSRLNADRVWVFEGRG
jgi:photosystem II stability/assembly factor-like uncharacterized protein